MRTAVDDRTFPRGIIFDLDGTLVDSLDDIRECLNLALRTVGRPERSAQEVRLMIGEGIRHLFRCAAETDDEALIDTMWGLYEPAYRERMLREIRPYPGVLDALDELTRRRVPMCVLSNKNHAFTTAITFALAGPERFIRVEGAREGSPRKPDPAVALGMAAAMALRPEHVYFVGDSAVDVQTARNAGMCAIGAAWGYRGREELLAAGAVHVVDHPSELPGIMFRVR